MFQRRRAAGLTLTELAHAIGKSYPSALAYESGRIVPPREALFRLAALFGCTVNDLLIYDDDDHA